MRLIDADELEQELIALQERVACEEGVNSYAYAALKCAGACVINAPTIEAEPVKHGKWIRYNRENICSECHRCNFTMTFYCPNCGANMDGGKT